MFVQSIDGPNQFGFMHTGSAACGAAIFRQINSHRGIGMMSAHSQTLNGSAHVHQQRIT